jgi:peroxiredoxin
MVELGQLERHHEEFAKRHARVVAVSLDKVEDSAETQKKFPDLTIISDADKSLANAAQVMAPPNQKSLEGGPTVAPTTAVIDRAGVIRWVSRKDNFMERTTPEEVLAALDALDRGR